MARLILHYGEQLDDVLANDWPMEELPTLPEVCKAQTKRIAQLEEEKAAALAGEKRAVNAHRMAAERVAADREGWKQKRYDAVRTARAEDAETHRKAYDGLEERGGRWLS